MREVASAREGLLIVNADDWGLDVPTTDAIAACFASGRISSATAMVHMADSERAAQVALAAGLPLGLHLNLSEPFTSSETPAEVLARQARVLPRFSGRRRRWQRWLPSRDLRAAVEATVTDQLAAFEALYGRPPTHVDGHKHVQVSPAVARTPALRGLMLRRAFSDRPGTRSPLALARRARHAAVLRGAAGTDRFLPIWSLRDDLRGGRRPALLPSPLKDVVEVMAHPGAAGELVLLQSEAWAEVLESTPLGTYADLR